MVVTVVGPVGVGTSTITLSVRSPDLVGIVEEVVNEPVQVDVVVRVVG